MQIVISYFKISTTLSRNSDHCGYINFETNLKMTSIIFNMDIYLVNIRKVFKQTTIRYSVEFIYYISLYHTNITLIFIFNILILLYLTSTY